MRKNYAALRRISVDIWKKDKLLFVELVDCSLLGAFLARRDYLLRRSPVWRRG